jgi:ABC-type uncharacterized transport system substrate-binding protein
MIALCRPAGALLAALLALAPRAAFAHPHIFIRQHVAALFNHDGLAGIRLTWHFDPLYSSMMRSDFVASRSGPLTPADVKALHDKCFMDLKDEHYFTTVHLNGKPLPLGDPTDFTAKADGDSIIYSFVIPLKPPPGDAPPTSMLDVTVFDRSYYVYYELAAEHPVTTVGGGPFGASCSSKAVWRPSIGWGTVHSDLVTCTFHSAGR